MTFTRAGLVVLDVALKRKTSTGLERPEMSWGEALAAAKSDWPAETLNPKTWFGDAMVTLNLDQGWRSLQDLPLPKFQDKLLSLELLRDNYFCVGINESKMWPTILECKH